MPINYGVGNGKHTPAKHEDVRRFLAAHMRLGAGTYHYIDVTAGRGVYQDEDTAPVDVMKIAAELNRDVRAILYEIERLNYLVLVGQVNEALHDSASAEFVFGDFTRTIDDTLPAWIGDRKRPRGLLYYDPNGGKEYEAAFDCFADMFARPEMAGIDLLMNVATHTIVRIRSRKRDPFDFHLDRALDAIPKRRTWTQEPRGVHRWALIYCTNREEFPGAAALRMHDTRRGEGWKILRALSGRRGRQKNSETHTEKASRRILENHSSQASQSRAEIPDNEASRPSSENQPVSAGQLTVETHTPKACLYSAENHGFRAGQRPVKSHASEASHCCGEDQKVEAGRAIRENHQSTASHPSLENHDLEAGRAGLGTLSRQASQCA